jgi:tetratricopeptide (TPR) repeat protein
MIAEVLDTPSSKLLDPENPYPGLQAFGEEDQSFFFGRREKRDELLSMVRREVLTVFFGRSGLGKTSLLRAGLFPVLREEQFLPIPIRFDFSSETGSLVGQVRKLITAELVDKEIEAPTIGADETLWEYFHRAQLWNSRNRLMMPLLIFDQFEEIFTLGRHDPRVQPFLVELSDLIENRIPQQVRARLERTGEDLPFCYDRQNFHVIISLREDYLPYLEDIRPLLPSISQNYFRLDQMNGGQALEAILKPGGHLVDEEVARQILAFIAGGRSEIDVEQALKDLDKVEIEPALLSLFCRELNEKRRAKGLPVITAELVKGERGGILSGYYDRSVADLPSLARIFIEERLLTSAGYRRSEPLEDALSYGMTREALQKLVDRRLLRLEKRFGTTQIELIHDRLKDVIVERRRARRDREHRRHRRNQLAAVGIGAGALVLTGLFVLLLYLQSRHEAEHRRQAEHIVHFMLFGMHDSLSRVGKLDLLENAQKEMLHYLDTRPDDDASDASRRGIVYHNIADIHLQQGETQEALGFYDKALAVFQNLPAEVSGDPDTRQEIGATHSQIGRALVQQGHLSQSLPHLTHAFEILGGLVQLKPENERFRESFQTCSIVLGEALLKLGRCNDGLSYLHKAVEVASAAVAKKPGDHALELNLADSYLLLATAEISHGEIGQAQETFAKAAEILDRQPADDQNLERARELAALKLGQGSLLLAQGRAADALAALNQAQELQRDVMVDGSVALARAAMLDVRTAIARSQLAQGDLQQASSTLDNALSTARRLTRYRADNPDWQRSLAFVTSLTGELEAARRHPDLATASYQKAIDVLEGLAKRSPEDISLRRALAWNHYLKGLSEPDSGSAAREWARAREVIEPVIARHVDDADVQDVYARILIALGQLGQAAPICAELRGKGWNWHGLQALCPPVVERRPGGTSLAAFH